MVPLADLGRIVLIIGIALAVMGGLLLLLSRVPGIGRLPGDVIIRSDGITCVIPLATMLIVSLLLTILVNVILALLRR